MKQSWSEFSLNLRTQKRDSKPFLLIQKQERVLIRAMSTWWLPAVETDSLCSAFIRCGLLYTIECDIASNSSHILPVYDFYSGTHVTGKKVSIEGTCYPFLLTFFHFRLQHPIKHLIKTQLEKDQSRLLLVYFISKRTVFLFKSQFKLLLREIEKKALKTLSERRYHVLSTSVRIKNFLMTQM